jgi:hypothetical protein
MRPDQKKRRKSQIVALLNETLGWCDEVTDPLRFVQLRKSM